MSPPAGDSLASVVSLLSVLSVAVGVVLYVWSALALSALFRKLGEERWKAWVPFLNIATLLVRGGFSPWLVILVVVPIVQVVVFVLVVVSAHRINAGFGYGGGMTVLAALAFVVWASVLGFGPARWLGARAAPRYRPREPAAPRESAAPRVSAVPRADGACAASDPAPFAPPVGAALPAGTRPDASARSGPIAVVPGFRAEPERPRPAASVTRLPAWGEVDPVSARPGPVAAVPESPAPPTRARREVGADDADAFPELSGEVSAVRDAPRAGAPRAAFGAVPAQHRRREEGASARPGEGAPWTGPRPIEADDDDVDDDIDATVVARRARRPVWELVPSGGAAIPLVAAVVILGRNPVGDPAFPAAQLIAVPDEARTVSKTHARIERRGDVWVVTDLRSTNGVFVRTVAGEDVEAEPGAELEEGRRFLLGDEQFHLRRVAR